MNLYLHAPALALCLLCSPKFPRFEYNDVKERALKERGSKSAGQYSSITFSKLKTRVSP